MDNNLPAVVFVHGAFADGSSWAKVIPVLHAAGVQCAAVQNPLSSLEDDVKATLRAVGMQKKPVLLVGHSWGGAVITEAGNDSRVCGLVYVAAGAPDSGQSFNDWWRDYLPSPGFKEVVPYGDDCSALTEKGVREDFVQDVSPDEATVVYVTQGPLNNKCFDAPVKKAAWHDKPSWYVVAENDRTIPPQVEKDSAARLKAKTLSLPSSHVPMLSRPKEVANFIMEALKELSEKKK